MHGGFGIDLQHRDMDHLNLAGWLDVVDNGTAAYDDHGHGTSMAGLLVAQGGLTGLALDVNLHVVKGLSSTGEGDDQDLWTRSIGALTRAHTSFRCRWAARPERCPSCQAAVEPAKPPSNGPWRRGSCCGSSRQRRRER